jgi:endonuclease-3
MKKATKKEIIEIKELFVQNYSDAVTELNYKNEYELIIAVALSAQCTDKRVNIITPELFEKYPDVYALNTAELDDIKQIINCITAFRIKPCSRLIKQH